MMSPSSRNTGVGIAHIRHAGLTHRGVRWDRSTTITGSAGFDDLERRKRRLGCEFALGLDSFDTCKRGIVLPEFVEERVDVA